MSILNDKLDNLNNFPIGIYKDNLDVCLFDFKKNFFNKITASELENTLSFTKELLMGLNQITKFKTYLIDSSNAISENFPNIVKYQTNFDEVLKNVNDNIDKIYQEFEEAGMATSIISKYQPMLFVIYNFSNFKTKLTSNLGDILTNLYNKSLKLPIINLIVIDNVDEFKKVEFETWFKLMGNPDQAIWIGEGISNQYTIKLVRSSDRALQTPLTNDFGYAVVNGKHALIKVLTFDTKAYQEMPQPEPVSQSDSISDIEEL